MEKIINYVERFIKKDLATWKDNVHSLAKKELKKKSAHHNKVPKHSVCTKKGLFLMPWQLLWLFSHTQNLISLFQAKKTALTSLTMHQQKYCLNGLNQVEIWFFRVTIAGYNILQCKLYWFSLKFIYSTIFKPLQSNYH